MSIIFSAFLFSCEKVEPEIGEPENEDTLKIFDLFPLKVGNEFYYTYSKAKYGIISEYTEGSFEWIVVSESSFDNYISHTIQEKFNAIVYTIPDTGDTTIINDEISTVIIYEEKPSSKINFMGFEFIRYQKIPEIKITIAMGPQTQWPSKRVVFKADSGLVYYNHYHPPNQVVSESWFLDSVKIIP